VADNTVKIIAAPFALVICLTLGGVYSLLNSAAVLQLFVNKLLPSIVDMAPLKP